MAVTDLTGYTWVANSTVSTHLAFSTSQSNPIVYKINDTEYSNPIAGMIGASGITFWHGSITPYQYYLTTDGYYAQFGLTEGEGWYNIDSSPAIKVDTFEVVFIGGDLTNTDLITWLEANGTLTPPSLSSKTLTVTYDGSDIIDSVEVSEDVTIVYGGQPLATLSDGTKTLKCNGKVMMSDVALGGKTLKCAGKKMASDVVVTVEGEPVPSGYNVTITSPTLAYSYIRVYDAPGGTELGQFSDTDTITFNNVTSLYVDAAEAAYLISNVSASSGIVTDYSSGYVPTLTITPSNDGTVTMAITPD